MQPAVFHLPPELEAALRTPRYSIAVKGAPGTGKSTLAMEILSFFGGGSSLYVSSRVSLEQIYRDFPWLKDEITEKSIIDMTNAGKTEKRSEFLFFDKPRFLSYLLSRVKELKRPRIVIFDSIEALRSILDMKSQELTLEHSLMSLIQETDANAVFVLESKAEHKIEYMVDGVIRLEYRLIDGRRTRRLIIEKLRGVEIQQSTYPFTLKDSRLSCPSRITLKILDFKEKHKVINDENKHDYQGRPAYSTGNKSFDEFIGGGYPKGALVLFELSKDAPPEMITHVCGATVENFLMQDRPVVEIPAPVSTPQKEKNMYRIMVHPEKLKNAVILWPEKESDETVVYVTGGAEEWAETAISEIERMKNTTGKPALLVFSCDTIVSALGHEGASEFVTIISRYIKDGDDLLILVSVENSEFLSNIRKMADIYIKVMCDSGMPLLYGVAPWTPVYMFTIDVSKPHPEIVLLPIL